MTRAEERAGKRGTFTRGLGAAISALAFGGTALAGPVDAPLSTWNDSSADLAGGETGIVPTRIERATDGLDAAMTFDASDPALDGTFGAWFHPEGGLDSFRTDRVVADWGAGADHVLLGESNSDLTFVPAPGALVLCATAVLVGLSRRRRCA